MPQFLVHRSNRQEVLSAQLAALLRDHPLPDPFVAETIIVQSLGMRRWLQLELARINGLCAGLSFPFPQTFIQNLLQKIYPQETEGLEIFRRDVLQWRIFSWFQHHGGQRFPDLIRYFSDDLDETKKWQLAARMAHLFDQYSAYRPDWLLTWQNELAFDWPAGLWHHLAGDQPVAHPAALRRRLLQELPRLPLEWLPPRLLICGLATLPPWYLEVLAALSQRVPVDLFLLQATPEFWGDLETPREAARRSRKKKAHDPNIEWNPLLAAWGRTGRDFLQLLTERNETVETDQFVEPSAGGLLGAVQADLLQPERSPVRPIADDSGSVLVHSCPGPMREVEIFYDQLLGLFQRLPELEPREILVMIPNLEIYAPLIEAVFGAPEIASIPYSLADGASSELDELGGIFLQVIDVACDRFEATKVLALLEISALRERQHFASTDVEIFRAWIAAANIRWGVDEKQRREEVGRDFRQNSWSAGLDSLLLGLTMETQEPETFGGILPCAALDGSEGDLLGRFLQFFSNLQTLRDQLRGPATLLQWSGFVRESLRSFFTPETLAGKLGWRLKEVLDGWETAARNVDEVLPFSVLRLQLAAALQRDETQLGFLNGGVTFCACRPMRSVPFEVIAFLGLNDGEFPRNPASSSLDRMAAEPRLGDRSLREDDRYLFLETVLSARQILYLSYVGRSPRDGSAKRPSAVISELLDYLDEQYVAPGQAKWSERLIVQHPLQAFAPQYFAAENPRSFSLENLRAARALTGPRRELPLWVSDPLPEPDESWRTVTPQKLALFFSSPAKFFVTQRAGLYLPRADEEPDDHEPFELNGLERFRLTWEATETLLETGDLADLPAAWDAAGVLPPEIGGMLTSARLRENALTFYEKLTPFLNEHILPPEEVDLTIGAFRILGSIDHRRSGGGLLFRPARMKTKDRLDAWLAQLISNASGWAEPMRLIAQDCDVVSWEALGQNEARQILETLLGIYWDGLCRPLPFFPRASAAYLRKHNLQEAWGEWRGSRFASESFSEDGDPFFNLCFGHLENPLDDQFIAVSEAILSPIPT